MKKTLFLAILVASLFNTAGAMKPSEYHKGNYFQILTNNLNQYVKEDGLLRKAFVKETKKFDSITLNIICCRDDETKENFDLTQISLEQLKNLKVLKIDHQAKITPKFIKTINPNLEKLVIGIFNYEKCLKEEISSFYLLPILLPSIENVIDFKNQLKLKRNRSIKLPMVPIPIVTNNKDNQVSFFTLKRFKNLKSLVIYECYDMSHIQACIKTINSDVELTIWLPNHINLSDIPFNDCKKAESLETEGPDGKIFTRSLSGHKKITFYPKDKKDKVVL